MSNGAGVTGVWTEGAERTSIAVDQCELLAGSLGFFSSFFQGSVICQRPTHVYTLTTSGRSNGPNGIARGTEAGQTKSFVDWTGISDLQYM